MQFPVDISFMPDNTRRLFQRLSGENFISKYSLVGGTALALQIKHRLSEDLTFIYDGEAIPIRSIKRNIARIFPDHRILRQDVSWQTDFLIDEYFLSFVTKVTVTVVTKIGNHEILW